MHIEAPVFQPEYGHKTTNAYFIIYDLGADKYAARSIVLKVDVTIGTSVSIESIISIVLAYSRNLFKPDVCTHTLALNMPNLLIFTCHPIKCCY